MKKLNRLITFAFFLLLSACTKQSEDIFGQREHIGLECNQVEFSSMGGTRSITTHTDKWDFFEIWEDGEPLISSHSNEIELQKGERGTYSGAKSSRFVMYKKADGGLFLQFSPNTSGKGRQYRIVLTRDLHSYESIKVSVAAK